MKIVLTNDDGIEAPGLEALREALKGMAETVVVAPADASSGCSHSTTTDRPFRVICLAEDRFAVEGTPADCVRVALHRFGSQIHCVVAGINNGGNLGVDVYHSGTVAAVREAVIHGVPGIAVSQYHNRPLEQADWRQAAEWTKPLLKDLLASSWVPGTFWNINLPNPDHAVQNPEIVFCPLDPSPLPLSFREDQDLFHYDGRYRERKRAKGTDVEVCFGGKIAVTQVTVMEASR